ncbi:hypothetical protein ECZU06_01710 [Escherichia coli]|nr:hypothetical protein ECZU06_01710 [Escherichia coli]
MRLHPQDLGEVQISLKVDDNRAQIQMVSPHQHVRAASKQRCRYCVRSWPKVAFS